MLTFHVSTFLTSLLVSSRVMQEFAFACNLYPVNEPFLLSVAGEVQ
jgi:hypothetical protein